MEWMEEGIGFGFIMVSLPLPFPFYPNRRGEVLKRGGDADAKFGEEAQALPNNLKPPVKTC